MIVYKSTNLINNKSYIGMTKYSLEQRMKGHLVSCSKKPQAFHKAINKYGQENFRWEIIDSSAKTIEELKQLEIEYIAKLKPEYNMTSGGDGISGFNHTKESKDKISKASKSRDPSVNNSISKKLKGRQRPQSVKDKISKSRKGIEPVNKGIPRDQSTKDKISKANKGRKCREETKKKISKKLKGQESPYKGRKHCEKTRKLISERTKQALAKKKNE